MSIQEFLKLVLPEVGISHVVFPTPSKEFLSRWGNDMALSLLQFGEAGVEITEVKYTAQRTTGLAL